MNGKAWSKPSVKGKKKRNIETLTQHPTAFEELLKEFFIGKAHNDNMSYKALSTDIKQM